MSPVKVLLEARRVVDAYKLPLRARWCNRPGGERLVDSAHGLRSRTRARLPRQAQVSDSDTFHNAKQSGARLRMTFFEPMI